MLLGACSSDPDLGSPGYVQGFAGAVVADEPHAALIGRDTLTAGGSAGDAAAATFFALAVTRPASAGLGAHGYCLDYRIKDQTQLAYRFESPGAVRAIAAIHARLGQLPLRQAIGPAEAMARFGFKRSLAFDADWRAVAPADPVAQAIFGTGEVGSTVQQLDLASLLGQIRQQGAGSFYTGTAARSIWAAAEQAGIGIDHAGWRQATPIAVEGAMRALGYHSLHHLPFAPANAGALPSQAETSMAVADGQGNAVACVFSMGQPFGIGRLTSGIFLATAGASAGEPVLVTNPNTKILLAVLAGGDTRQVLESIAAQTLEEKVPLSQALGKAHANFINGIVCVKGIPNYPESCTASTDPAGHGLAAIGEAAR